jgi:hypothetical protein
MTAYLADTNILIEFGHAAAVRAKFEAALQNGSTFRIAPPALIELVRGMIRGGSAGFDNNRIAFVWLRNHDCQILDLPKPFMARILRTSTRQSGVEPEHYRELIKMIACAADFDEFTTKAQVPGGVWRDIGRADEIHQAELDRELAAIVTMARRSGSQNVASGLSRMFGIPGCRPNPLILQSKFSAALEFLETSLARIRGSANANPRQNDPGRYIDFQLLLYLADPETFLLTSEKFSKKIKTSPQKSRIVGLESLS